MDANGKGKAIITIGIACVVILSVLLLTNAKNVDNPAMTLNYNAEILLKYKSPYIGDGSNVANLLNSLPLGDYKTKLSLETKKPPYILNVDYDLKELYKSDVQSPDRIFWGNSAVLFSLIDNLEIIRYTIRDGKGISNQDYTRTVAQEYFKKDLRSYSKKSSDFKLFLGTVQDLGKELFPMVSRTMKFSELVGMETTEVQEVRLDYIGNNRLENVQLKERIIISNLLNNLDRIKLITAPKQKKLVPPTKGFYITLSNGNNKAFYYVDFTTGGIAKHLASMSSYPNFTHLFADPKQVEKIVGEYFGPGPQSLDEAVAQAVLTRIPMYYAGEVATEGHIILGQEEKGNQIKVYSIASYGSFGFENGIFTKVSGSGGIPTVMTFSKTDKGGYTLIEYQEPRDGSDYAKSLRQMFPKSMLSKLEGADFSDLGKQQEAQAREYLRSIGRKAQVTVNHVEKKLPPIHVEASNKLFSEMTKYNHSLAKYPYWLGTRETVEDGVRYIYETSLGKTADSDLIVFRKTKADGTLVEELRYKIVGREPKKLLN